MTSTLQRIVRVDPMQRSTDPQVIGDVIPVILACGHTVLGNPTMTHKVGDLQRCWKCKP